MVDRPAQGLRIRVGVWSCWISGAPPQFSCYLMLQDLQKLCGGGGGGGGGSNLAPTRARSNAPFLNQKEPGASSVLVLEPVL